MAKRQVGLLRIHQKDAGFTIGYEGQLDAKNK